MADFKREAETKARDTADTLGNMVNIFSHDSESFIDQLTNRTHRTLQQSVGKLIFKCIRKWGNMYRLGQYDGRNEYLCHTCQLIDDYMVENHNGVWDNLPMI